MQSNSLALILNTINNESMFQSRDFFLLADFQAFTVGAKQFHRELFLNRFQKLYQCCSDRAFAVNFAFVPE